MKGKNKMNKLSIYIFIFFCFTLLGKSQLSQAQVDTFFKRFTNNTEQMENLFSKSLLDKVPATQLASIRNSFETKYGKYVKVIIESNNHCKVYYEKAIFPCIINFDNSGLVNTLWFGAPSFANDNIEKIKQELSGLQGVVSVCIRKDGKEIYSLKKDLPLAIGSTFKLYILKALVHKIEKGQLHWEDTLHIDEYHKSLPSGILQNWPSEQVVTINTLANLMISLSDNTAADLLIDKIGREYIEQFAPSTMQPFYKTKELFVLKLDRSDEYIKWFVNADTKTKRLELKKMDTVNISQLNIYKFTKPIHLGIEWFATTEQLCKVIESLKDAPALSINAGIVDKKDWYFVAYKGGSEPGVLNYTYLLQKESTSPIYSLSVTINDVSHVVDEDHKFTIIVSRIIDILGENNQ